MTSAIDRVLQMLNPMGNAEASPLAPGMPNYPYANASRAALAFGAGKSDDEVWQKYGLYKSPTRSGRSMLLGEIPDKGVELFNSKKANPTVLNFLANAIGLTDDQGMQDVPVGSLGKTETHPAIAVLNHANLFNNAPALKSIPVNSTRYAPNTLPSELGSTRVHSTNDWHDGKYSVGPLNFGVYDTLLRGLRNMDTTKRTVENIDINHATNKDYVSTLLHELTHAAQVVYGFAPNDHVANPLSDIDAYTNSPSEEQARMTQVRLRMPPAQLKAQSPKTTIEMLRNLGTKQLKFANTK